MEVSWKVKTFNEFTLKELYNVLALRMDVFVVEQDCPYQDLDGKDLDAFHIFATDQNGNVVATARILKPGVAYEEVAIGRVVTAASIREFKKGHELMAQCMEFVSKEFPNQNIRLSAQSHLVNYYGKHGFKETGKNYLEDGIPHSEMLCEVNLAN